MKRSAIIFGAVLLVAALAGGALYWFFAVRQPTYVLEAKYVTTEPKLDGSGEETVWQEAEPLTIPIKNGKSVTIKVVYTKQKVFFLARYDDATKDDLDEVWEYDGQEWQHGRTSDEFSLFFNTNGSIKGFKDKGMAVMNRGFKPGEKIYNIGLVTEVSAAERKVWPGAKQKGDLWEMSTSLTSPFGKAHDFYFGIDPGYTKYAYTLSTATLLVRHDSMTLGVPFILNQKTAGVIPEGADEAVATDKPVFMFKPGKTIKNTPYPTPDDMVEITDYSVFKKGDQISWIIYKRGSEWGGSVDDVDGKAVWSQGKWTVETGRKLATGHNDDIKFNPVKGKSASYDFSVLVRSDGKTIRYGPPATLTFLPQGG